MGNCSTGSCLIGDDDGDAGDAGDDDVWRCWRPKSGLRMLSMEKERLEAELRLELWLENEVLESGDPQLL